MAKRSRKEPNYAHDLGVIEVMKLDPYLDYLNPYKDVQDMVVIGISGEIGEAYKD
ncbi:MAG: hypothetical protein J6W09_04500 [Bacteroidales bacterium]|nr:hypothetical protein [Bacteroidales bacterium]